MTQYWCLEREVGNIAVLILNREDKELNVLSEAVLRDLDQQLTQLDSDPSLEGVVIISGKKDFIVGADIEEIAAFHTTEEATEGSAKMQGLFQKLAAFRVPTVAAIHGQCLGGGLELALACTWRMMTDASKTKVGLPEIQLGLIPGAGGTQRLPRIIGIQNALDLILTGKRIPGKKAKKIGLADAVVPEQILRTEAIKLAGQKKKPKSSLPDILPSHWTKGLPKLATEGNPLGRKVIQRFARDLVNKKTHGKYPASYSALQAVFDGFEMSLAKGLELEAKLFGQLAMTPQSRSLVHLFHATNHLKKHPSKAAGEERFGKQNVKMVGIFGSGFMGAGIATVCADRNVHVRYSDPSKESLGRALKHSHDYFKRKLDKRRLKPHELHQRMSFISPGLSVSGFAQCDVIVEAVFEDLNLKRKLLEQVEELGGENLIFASNTSAIPIKEIAAFAKHPEKVIGMHFFSPVEKMPLLEVVYTEQTADWVLARTIQLGQAMGKQVITVRDGPGFYTTRALSFYLNEASLMLAEGVAIDEIDKALTEWGFPVGPIALIDEVGIDVGIHVLDTMKAAFPDRISPPEGLSAIADSGRLGRKNNKGFYLYEKGKKTKPDASVYDVIGVKPRSSKLQADEIVDRCLLAFVNESVACLEENILQHPFDGDVGAVFGLGFPPFHGGPFHYVDTVGAETTVEQLRQLADKYGDRFTPSKMLLEYAESKKLFFPS